MVSVPLVTPLGHLVGSFERAHHLSAAADAVPGEPEVAGLRPPVLDDLGLAASLASLGRSFPQLDVQVEAVSCRIAEHVETAVYRTAQQALQNVVKHARARAVRVHMSVRGDHVLLEVRDDGQRLAAAASPGRGTAVRLMVPLSPARQAM